MIVSKGSHKSVSLKILQFMKMREHDQRSLLYCYLVIRHLQAPSFRISPELFRLYHAKM